MGPKIDIELSFTQNLLLLGIVILSISSPFLLANITALSKIEPAYLAGLAVILVSLLSYVGIYYAFPEVPSSQRLSSSFLLGLIAGHVGVFHINKELPTLALYGLFGFLFYYHFDHELRPSINEHGKSKLD